jgi:hypothetical protein
MPPLCRRSLRFHARRVHSEDFDVYRKRELAPRTLARARLAAFDNPG